MSPPYHLRRLAFIWLPLLVAGGLFFALGAATTDNRPQDVGALLTALGLFAIICDRAPHPTHA